MTTQQGDDLPSEIVPGARDDGALFRRCNFYGEPARTADGSVALPCDDPRAAQTRWSPFAQARRRRGSP